VDKDWQGTRHSNGNMTRVALSAKLPLRHLAKGQARDDCHSVITGLPVFSNERVSGLEEITGRKLARWAFGLLKAKNVDFLLLQKAQS
jgi:hypothetical protein